MAAAAAVLRLARRTRHILTQPRAMLAVDEVRCLWMNNLKIYDGIQFDKLGPPILF